MSKRFSSRSGFKFRGSNDDRNAIYSCPTEVISDAILFGYPYFARPPPKKWARVSHEIAQFVLKIAHFAISMEPTLLLDKTLRSVHFGVVVVEQIHGKCGGIVRNEIW